MDLHNSGQILEEIERVRLYLNELEEARAKIENGDRRNQQEGRFADFIDIYSSMPIEEQKDQMDDEQPFEMTVESDETVESNDFEEQSIEEEEQKLELGEASLSDEDVMETTADELRNINQIQLVQSILKRIGIYGGRVNGQSSEELDEAICAFRKQHGISCGNRLDRPTIEKLENYLYGYEMYLIRRGDTIQSVAERTGNSVRILCLANPKMDIRFLRPGKRMVIPMWNDTVPTDVAYTYNLMKKNIYGFKTRFPYVDIGIIGKSVQGKNIYSIKLGEGSKSIMLNASHHGLEWLNSILLMKFTEEYLNAYSTGGKIGDLDAGDLWKSFSIYIVPMVNPDGVDLVLKGILENETFYDYVQEANKTGRPINKVWNANVRGVDLNRNYDASWEKGKEQEVTLGVDGPGPTRFGGVRPLSEPETQAMVAFTNNNDFDTTVSYHSQGNTIFASGNIEDGTGVPKGTYPLLTALEEGTSYGVENVPEEMAFAGYKDWFVEKFNRPAFTIETGSGINPLDISQFNDIYEDNFNGIIELLKSM